jgi:hypothetical protein
MTKVIHLPSRRAGIPVQPTAQSLNLTPADPFAPIHLTVREQALASALQQIVLETMAYPPGRPFSSDSRLPDHLIELAQEALQPSLQAPSQFSERLTDAIVTPGRQAAIENALSMALYFVRKPDVKAADVWAATSRANRALTLLKQASEGATLQGRV